MDVLADILASLHLTGGVVLDAETSGDWCLFSQFTAEDCEAFMPGPGQVIAYHYIRAGKLWAQVEGYPVVEAGPGSILMFPRNDRHLLFTNANLPPIDSHDFIQQDGSLLARVRIDNPGEEVDFYCGFLGVSGSRHPLIETLPAQLLISDGGDASAEWMESSMRLLAAEQQSPDMVARIAELLFAQGIRRYIADLPEGETGWLAAIRDPAVSRALAIIHARYAEELDVEGLAREVGLSRSALGERFVALLGEPPMRYCARWRMRMAANMLREGQRNTAGIAYAVGFNSEAAFNRAFKREFGDPPAAWRRKAEAEAGGKPAPLPVQRVQYCAAHDGTRLAYSVVGEGPALVKAANWLNHIEHDWDSPIWRHWIGELIGGHQLVRYDERGNGLSDWDTPDISFEAFVDDLGSVVDAAGLERFDLLGISQGAATSIAYAVRYPERVRRLVIFGGYACGWKVRADPEEVERREAMITLAKMGWGSDNPAYRQLFTGLYMPQATPEQAGWFNDMQRLSASPSNAVKLQQVMSLIDVRHLLPQVAVPTLILHSRGDHAIPATQGQALADGIPGAEFELLDSDNHLLLDNEPAWGRFVTRVRDFLDQPDEPVAADPERIEIELTP